jgi:hypothetical protein
MKDTYLLRISNVSTATGVGAVRFTAAQASPPAPTAIAANNEFSVNVPPELRNKGKCQVKVVGGLIGLGIFGADTSTVPDDTRLIYLQSNISFLGHDVQQNGNSGAILGSYPITNGDIITALELPSAYTASFTCSQLPPVITISKWYLVLNNTPTQAGEYTTNPVPCFIDLELSFHEDHCDCK